MKKKIIENLPTYIKRDARLPVLLQRCVLKKQVDHLSHSVRSMKDHGATVFLATNSDYPYTQAVMTYLFDVEPSDVRFHNAIFIFMFILLSVLVVLVCFRLSVCMLKYAQGSTKRNWKAYFDLIVVSAKKPLFFEEGSVMREVNQVR